MTLDELLLVIAPELSTIDPAVRTAFEGYATLQVQFGEGDLQQLAIANLAAHMLTMTKRGGVGGQVQSQSEGELSITYANYAGFNSGYAQTAYGLEYLRYRNMFVLSFTTRVRTCPAAG